MCCNKMKTLHICSNYFGSKVHQKLCRSLDDNGLAQTIYSYFDGEDKIGKNEFVGESTDFVFSNILNPLMRKIYPLKRNIVFKDLKRKVKLQDYSCVFATTLFSDGGVALKVKKEFGIPYIVAVRNTDINYFMPIKLFWRYGRDILLNASKIVFISPAKMPSFFEHGMVRPILGEVKDKIILQPNGIDSYWLDNISLDKRKNNYAICYVGIFSKEKNVLNLIDAIISLQNEFPDIQLNIVGGGGDQESEVKRKAKESNCIHLLGYISDKERLRKIYHDNSLYAMPSHHETFGLVYVEAMSQGLPVIYTKNEAIDGMFRHVGEAVDSTSVDSIADGIRRVFMKYGSYDIHEEVNFDLFNWNSIANNYLCILKEIIKN